MKNLIRGLVVSALALGSVAVASPLAHADDPDNPPVPCADVIQNGSGAEYTGSVYVASTDLTLDPSDAVQRTLLSTVPTESDGTLNVVNKLAAPSCPDVTYELTVIYPDQTSSTYTKTGDGTSTEIDFSVHVARHTGYCIQAQVRTLAGGFTQDVVPDASETPATVCNDGGGGGGGWY